MLVDLKRYIDATKNKQTVDIAKYIEESKNRPADTGGVSASVWFVEDEKFVLKEARQGVDKDYSITKRALHQLQKGLNGINDKGGDVPRIVATSNKEGKFYWLETRVPGDILMPATIKTISKKFEIKASDYYSLIKRFLDDEKKRKEFVDGVFEAQEKLMGFSNTDTSRNFIKTLKLFSQYCDLVRPDPYLENVIISSNGKKISIIDPRAKVSWKGDSSVVKKPNFIAAMSLAEILNSFPIACNQNAAYAGYVKVTEKEGKKIEENNAKILSAYLDGYRGDNETGNIKTKELEKLRDTFIEATGNDKSFTKFFAKNYIKVVR